MSKIGFYGFFAFLLATSALSLPGKIDHRHITLLRELSAQEQPNEVGFSPNGDFIAAAIGQPYGRSGSVTLWDVNTGDLRDVLRHSGGITTMAISPNGKYLAGGSGGFVEAGKPFGELLLWDLQTSEVVYSSRAHQAGVTSVAFSPDGKLLASASHDGTVRICEVPSGRFVRSMTGAWTGEDMMSDLAFSPDGSYLAVSDTMFNGEFDSTGRVLVWETKTWRLRREFVEPHHIFSALDFSPDGKTLAGGSTQLAEFDNVQGVVRIWNVTTGKLLQSLKPFHVQREGLGEIGLRVVIFSQDGKTLLTGSGRRVAGVRMDENGQSSRRVSLGPGLIRLWDVGTGRLLRTTQAHEFAINNLSISSDGKQLVSSSFDRTIRLWNFRAAP
jgi:WD40 repeat protein